MKIESIKRFVTHYAWAGTIIGFAVGLLFGPGTLWKYFEFRQKSQSAEIEQIRLEKELYERLQVLQNQISSAILQYIPLRDRYVSLRNEGPSQEKYAKTHEVFVSQRGYQTRPFSVPFLISTSTIGQHS
jgi:hypothetical protein